MIESYIPGPLAQLAEQGPFKPLVTGSSPVRLTSRIHCQSHYIQDKKFDTISCTQCQYTEVYKNDTTTILGNVLDAFGG